MAPITQASDESNHTDLLLKLDIHGIQKPFRKATWKPPMRRNKNVRQIISEAARATSGAKDTSTMGTQNNSGTSTPVIDPSNAPTTGAGTPSERTMVDGLGAVNLAQASRDLSKFAQENNALSVGAATSNGAGSIGPPAVTFTNIESAPSLKPGGHRHYCDITGLPAPYTDPKTRLRYHNREMFNVIRSLAQGGSDQYLAARGAHVILK